ncbi:MAG: rRNA pseudouridine synthase [Cyclobacteriaceae bacterium]|nr:rRNA pseudouridine synthase [Cyclobacteriaceae bacterium]
MARPRKSSATSFGKRTNAEKSFRTRKKKPEGRFTTENPRKKFERSEGTERTTRFGRSAGKPVFGKSDSDSNEGSFKKRSFQSDKPGGKRSGGFVKPSTGFTKRRFEDGDDKPFKKRSFQQDSLRFEKKVGYEKKRFNDTDNTRSFKKSGGFDRETDGPNRFEKKRFDSETGNEKPIFKKRESGRVDLRSSGPARFTKKPFGRKQEGDDQKEGSSYGLPYKRKPYNKQRDVTSPKRGPKLDAPKTDSDLIRLNKFIANSGVGSRREADELIKMGLVTVNGEVITEMGHKVKRTDDVRYEGKKLKAEKPVYILLNKPKGFITTTDDPQERKTVMNLVANAGPERIYPVGRLDRNTTGLLLLTNDGDLADKLTHPSYNVKKIYRVELDKPITKSDFEKIKAGVHLEEGRAVVDDLAIVDGDNRTIGIELHIGWNRIVRRIFESLGYVVEKLDRVVYAGLDKKDLNRGEWRFLKAEEIIKLKHFK